MVKGKQIESLFMKIIGTTQMRPSIDAIIGHCSEQMEYNRSATTNKENEYRDAMTNLFSQCYATIQLCPSCDNSLVHNVI